MQVEIGKIYEGKVTGITKFGAFVELDKQTTGMVHISEVANAFVSEIKDHIQEGQMVKVKVLNVSEDGKISFSIKKAVDNPPPRAPRPQNFRRDDGPRREGGFSHGAPRKEGSYSDRGPRKQFEKKAPAKPVDPFEDMLNKFKQNSEEKMSDLKRNMDGKRRNTSRRSGGKN